MRLVIVSNRLPVVITNDQNDWKVRGGSGGLVTALGPVLRRWGGVWIGWPGAVSTDEAALNEVLARYGQEAGYDLRPVPMSNEEVEGFYHGFCNEIIWPLFHDLLAECNFVPDYWTQYLAVKDRFAKVVQQCVEEGDFVWIHDYHLMGLGRPLRERGLHNRLGFFLHIPFPPPDIFCALPWRDELLRGLTQYDIIGFQTPRDRENFLDCMRRLLPEARLHLQQGMVECRLSGRSTLIGSFPIGIDYDEFADAAAAPATTARVEEIRKQMPGQQIILGLDRLDYTKGIP